MQLEDKYVAAIGTCNEDLEIIKLKVRIEELKYVLRI